MLSPESEQESAQNPKSANTGHTGDKSGYTTEDITREVNNLNDINIK